MRLKKEISMLLSSTDFRKLMIFLTLLIVFLFIFLPFTGIRLLTWVIPSVFVLVYILPKQKEITDIWKGSGAISAGLIPLISIYINPGFVWQFGDIGAFSYVVLIDVLVFGITFLLFDVSKEENTRRRKKRVFLYVIIAVSILLLASFYYPYVKRNDVGQINRAEAINIALKHSNVKLITTSAYADFVHISDNGRYKYIEYNTLKTLPNEDDYDLNDSAPWSVLPPPSDGKGHYVWLITLIDDSTGWPIGYYYGIDASSGDVVVSWGGGLI